MGWENDTCGHLWELAYADGGMVFPEGGSVLEIGCDEYDWITPLLTVRPDVHVTGIDWRHSSARRAPAVILQGDVLTHDFPPASFDAIVGISSIEHIGLGHYQSDPLDADGDRHCMERVAGWLKPGGWFYADVPYGPQYRVEGTSHRIYDDAAVDARLLVPGLRAVRRWHHDNGPTASYHYVAVHAVKD